MRAAGGRAATRLLLADFFVFTGSLAYDNASFAAMSSVSRVDVTSNPCSSNKAAVLAAAFMCVSKVKGVVFLFNGTLSSGSRDIGIYFYPQV